MTGPPLAGRRVLVCRAEGDARPLADELRRLGAEPVLVPLVARTSPRDGGAGLRSAVGRLDRYHWVAVTSAAGAVAFADALVGRSLPPSVRLAAVGPATAAALAAAGLRVDLVPPSSTAADLAAAFPSPDRPGPRPAVLAPLAELAGDDLVDGLLARGYAVDRVDAYRLADPAELAPPPTEGDIRTGSPTDGVDAVLFTSPSIVDRFLDRFGPESVPPVAVCIGPRTAARATARGLHGLTVAADHTSGGLVAALLDALSPDRSLQ